MGKDVIAAGTYNYIPLADDSHTTTVTGENGIRQRFTRNGTYIGPERPFDEDNILIRLARTVYTYSVFFITQIVLFVAMFPLAVVSILLQHIHICFRPLVSFCDMVNNAIVGSITWFSTTIMLAPALRIIPEYAYNDEMTCSSPTEEGLVVAKSRLEEMIEKSKSTFVNRVRALFGYRLIFRPTSCIIMIAPHTTNLDAIAAMSMRWATAYRIFYKSNLAWIPFFGWNLLLDRNIAVPFKRGAAADDFSLKKKFTDDSLNRQLDHILDGDMNVSLFPEGGRTLYGRMMPFRYGTFKQSLARNVPICVYALNGGNNMTPPGSVLIKRNRMTIRASPLVIYPEGHTLESLVACVRDEVYRLQCEFDATFDPDTVDAQIASPPELKAIARAIKISKTVDKEIDQNPPPQIAMKEEV